MNIQPLTHNITTFEHQPKTSPKNQQTKITFTGDKWVIGQKGKKYPSGYYTNQEIHYARYSLNFPADKWQDEVLTLYNKRCLMKMNFLNYAINATSKMEKLIYKIANLRGDLLNEKLQEIFKQEEKIKQDITNEAIIIQTKNLIKTKLLDKINSKISNIPTALMISGSDYTTRNNILDWIINQTSTSCRRCIHNCQDKDTEQTLYLMNTETKYASDQFNTQGYRSIIRLNRFEQHLRNDHSGLKEFLFDISEEKAPVTFIFEVQDTKNIASPYTGNARRIPIQIRMDNNLLKNKAISVNDLKVVGSSYFKPYYDGYKMNNRIELFLGDFGFNENVLWVNSQKSDDIKQVLNSINDIIVLDKFKNIKSLQCPIKSPKDIANMVATNNFTLENCRIYSLNLLKFIK